MKKDSFHSIKREVESEYGELTQTLSLWKKTHDVHQQQQYERQISDSSKGIMLNLKRIEESFQFSEYGLQQSEISLRKDFIYDIKQKVNACVEQLNQKEKEEARFNFGKPRFNDLTDKDSNSQSARSGIADQRLLQKKNHGRSGCNTRRISRYSH